MGFDKMALRVSWRDFTIWEGNQNTTENYVTLAECDGA